MAELIDVPPNLAGVAVADTEVGDVVGDRGFYHYRGRSAPELARDADFEAAATLLLGQPPGSLDLRDRGLPPEVAELVDRLDLRSGVGLLATALGCRPMVDLDPAERSSDAGLLIATMPTLVASIANGHPAEPDPQLGHVADFLRMLRGRTPAPKEVRALETYMVLTLDHGFANSTFVTRVVASAGADIGACVLAALGSAGAPRHGAAIGLILDMLDAIGEPDRAREWMRNEMAEGRRLPGFGHSVYSRPDPRLVLLREHGAVVAPDRHRLAMAAEEAGTELLAGRRLVPNVDLHAGVVLEGCGIPRDQLSATFATARIVGWCAHAIEQAAQPRIIRPAARYVGPPPDEDVY